MIALVSSSARERTAFATLCDTGGWSCTECDSVRSFLRLIHRTTPRVAIIRHRLDDGFADDALAGLANLHLLSATKVIVLLGAGTSSAIEARQLTLGADCVQRDPVRSDVLLAYLAKYIAQSRHLPANNEKPASKTIPFADGTLLIADRILQRQDQVALLTPREVALVELMAHSRGELVTYDTLYSEILGRQFRGDTSNMRVLLGKLSASIRPIGIELPRWVEVLPKTGYRYKTYFEPEQGIPPTSHATLNPILGVRKA